MTEMIKGISPQEYILNRSIPEPNTGCWLWLGSTKGKGRLAGYGAICTSSNSKRRDMLAHRFSFEAFNYKIPDGCWILHQCDNPACVNPEHLLVGNNKTNVLDKVAKGRQSKGNTHGRSTTTWDVVRKIRSEYVKKVVTAPMLAKKYGIGVSAVELILANRTWKEESNEPTN